MKKKKLIALALTAIMAMGCLTACGGGGKSNGGNASTPAAGEEKDTLRVAMASDAASLDPAGAIDVYSQMAYGNILETLVTLDENDNVIPQLAEYEMLDDVTYQFKLKQGVKFHNGEELKASDVAFTLKRGTESPVLNFIYSSVVPESIEVVDEYTVKLSLNAPSAPFLMNMTSYAAGVLSEKAVTEAGDSYAMNPVGTGPYKFVKWDKGVSIELTRFDEYWDEPAKIQNVTIRPIPEATNRTIELESGGVDISCDISTTDVSRVRDNGDLVLHETVANSVTFLGFNCQMKPFDDVRVRQAVCHAIDAEGVVAAVLQGYGVLSNQPVSSNLAFSDPNAKHIEYNVEKAKALLAEAGYPDGFEMTIICDERKERVDVATIVQSQLAEVGITVKVESMEWATFLGKAYGAEAQAFVLGWSSAVPDPDMVAYSCFHSSMIGNGNNNLACLNDPEVDALLDQGRTSFDTATRADAYSKLYARLNELVPWDYFWVESKFVGTGADVDGFVIDPMGVYQFDVVSFK